MTAKQIIDIFLSFYEKRGHTQIANAPLVPENDPTTLFTSSGMQPLVPYLLGETHPAGNRLVDVQNCFRSQDIEEVGDNRHTTFFRMLGNWSLGDYFKKEQLPWFFEFLTSKEEGLGLDPKKLYVTVFAGDTSAIVETAQGNEIELGLDADAIATWKRLFEDRNIQGVVVDMTNPNLDLEIISTGRIFCYGSKKNWWSRSGIPEKMPPGEPGGPDSEVFYDFGTEFKFHENSKYRDQLCHVNCDCGRFLEIGNSVFMQYKKLDNRTFEELPKKNVDFGGGLERLAAAIENNPDIFSTDLYQDIIKVIEEYSNKKYDEDENKAPIRVIADHLKAATYLMVAGVRPSNKEQGYVLRRLLRRAAVKMHALRGGLTPIPAFEAICDEVLRIEETIDNKIDRHRLRDEIFSVIDDEMTKFGRSLDKGLNILNKTEHLDAKLAFDLYQTYGFPIEITAELLAQKGLYIDLEDFMREFFKHKELSRTASAGKFKGGLADAQDLTVKGHTATHLLHQAIRDLLGTQVHQSGSNITTERLRFDFNFDRKLTDEELENLEQTVNAKIKEDLPVRFEMMPLKKAKEIGAIGLFDEKYQENVKVYIMGGTGEEGDYTAYSKEFCGGPHVPHTGVIQTFKITKQEKLGNNLMRLYAVVS